MLGGWEGVWEVRRYHGNTRGSASVSQSKTEGKTAGEQGKGRWPCVGVRERRTHHLQSPWRWCGGCSRGKCLAPRPPGAAPHEVRSAPTAPSHRGVPSGYLWWVGCWGLKGQAYFRSPHLNQFLLYMLPRSFLFFEVFHWTRVPANSNFYAIQKNTPLQQYGLNRESARLTGRSNNIVMLPFACPLCA